MAKLITGEVLDRLGVVLLPKVRVSGFSAEQSGAVQFFLYLFKIDTLRKTPLPDQVKPDLHKNKVNF